MPCLRERLAGIDWAAAESEEVSMVAALISELFFCVPGPLATQMIAESGSSEILGFNPEDLSQEEAHCVGTRMAGMDWERFIRQGTRRSG